MKTRIWNCTKAFPSKVNFIDSNDVILGYDLGSSCCEYACWTVSESRDGSNPLYKGDENEEQIIELDGYTFDPAFFERIDEDSCETYVALFKLRDSSHSFKPDLYVRLENHQNGYYSHGFTFRGDAVIKDAL